jgi:glycosyltransferase involved in cell wall biosynthesis
VRVIGLGDGDRITVDDQGVVRVPAVYTHRLALYPDMLFGIPHVPALLQYVVDEQIDIIQCATPGPMGVAGLLVARLTGIPLVGQYHTDVPEYATRLSGDPVFGAIIGQIVGWFYRQMDRVLVPSESVAQRMRQLRIEPEKITRVPRGIDLDLFQPHWRNQHAYEEFGINGDPKVLYVGRISKEKGLDVLVDSWRAVSHPTAKLILVGDGPYLDQLAQRAEPGRVVFAGEQTGEKLARLYASCDLFVCPSETETFGNTVVEAQAAGVPVVVADRGAACENIVDGVTGVAVNARSTGELQRAIQSLLDDQARRLKMGQAARAFAERYGMAAAVRGTFDIYEQFLRTAARPEHHHD